MAPRKPIADRKRGALADFLAARTREAFNAGQIPTLLSYEGVHRATIRSVLCLRGVGWAEADRMAKDVVNEVLMRLMAKRPGWAEGQPEWTIQGGTLIERTHCIHCQKDLPEGHFKFCAAQCRGAHGRRMMRMRDASEEQMAKLASKYDL